MATTEKNLPGQGSGTPDMAFARIPTKSNQINDGCQKQPSKSPQLNQTLIKPLTNSTGPSRRALIEERIRQGFNVNQIAAEVNCDRTYVYKIARECKVKVCPTSRGPRPIYREASQGRLAEQIGRDLFFYREMTKNLTLAEIGQQLNMTVAKVAKAESGHHVWTLPELTRLSKLLGKSLVELLTEQPIKMQVKSV